MNISHDTLLKLEQKFNVSVSICLSRMSVFYQLFKTEYNSALLMRVLSWRTTYRLSAEFDMYDGVK